MDKNEESTNTPAPDQYDEFDAAFDDASAEPGTQAAPAPAPVTEPDAEPAKPTEPSEPDDGATDDGEGTDGQQPDAEPSAPAEPPKPTEPVVPTQPALDPKYLAAAIAEANRLSEQEKPPAPQPEAKPLTRDDFLNDADKAAIKKFETEWPDENVAIQKLVQAELQALIGNRFNDYTKQLNGVLAPLFGSVQSVEVNTYKGAITAAHPDAFDIAPKVAEWINTQPAFMRPAFTKAFEGNNAQEAIELLNLYKQATGPTGAAPATPASSAAQETPKPAPKPVANPAAVKALAAVPAAQRPKPTGGADVLDFDAAFAEAAESLANS